MGIQLRNLVGFNSSITKLQIDIKVFFVLNMLWQDDINHNILPHEYVDRKGDDFWLICEVQLIENTRILFPYAEGFICA